MIPKSVLDFEVEIATGPMPFGVSAEGSLIFDKQVVREALDYELAFASMGGKDRPLGIFFFKWSESPVAELHVRCLLHREVTDTTPKEGSWFGPARDLFTSEAQGTSSLLVLDYGEHVLLEFEKLSPRSKKPRRALDEVREFVRWKFEQLRTGANDVQEHRHGVARMERLLESLRNLEISGDLRLDVFRAFLESLQAWGRWDHGIVFSASKMAVQGVATSKSGKLSIYSRTPPQDMPEAWQIAAKAEKRWQVRRFVDVMTALRAGRPWPALGATS